MTGGTGLVGREIVRHLRGSEDIELAVISRKPPVRQYARVNWFQHDLSSGLPVPDELFEGVECVVHGAAHLGHSGPDDYLAASRLNFSATTELYEKAVKHGVRKIVYLSGFNFLKKPLQPCIDETHEVGPATPYALGKLWGEYALFAMLKDSTTIPLALRITSPVPRSVDELHDTVLKRWIVAARSGRSLVVYGLGGRRQDYVSTKDVAMAVSNAIRGDVSGVFNIASGEPVSNIDVARLVAQKYGVRIEHQGVDTQEEDVWNVSVERARHDLGFLPSMSSLDSIRALIE